MTNEAQPAVAVTGASKQADDVDLEELAGLVFGGCKVVPISQQKVA